MGGYMAPVERTVLVQIRMYLRQVDGVLIVALKAGEGEMPDRLQNAIWAAAVLVEQTLAIADDLENRCEVLIDGAGI